MEDSKEKELYPESPGKYKSVLSIRFKMLLYFGLLFTAILIILKLVEFWGLPLLGLEGKIKIQEAEVLKSLDLLADQKKAQIVKWLEERQGNTRVLVEGNFGKRVIELQSWIQKNNYGNTGKDLRENVKADTNYKEIIKQISLVKTSYGVYSDIDIIDPAKQTIIASTDSKRLASAPAYPESLSRFQSSKAGYLINFQKNKNTGLLELLIFDAIKHSEKTIAILIIHINPEDIIRPILQMGKGLGETGEALLVDRDVRILTSLKHLLPDGTVPKPFEHIIGSNPAKFAAQRSQGITISLDYRGEPVLAAYRYIPLSTATGWGLVVKRDQAEVFASLNKSIYYSIGVDIVGLIVTLCMAYLIASNLSLPIKDMSTTADRVAKGDLDARMNVSGFKEAYLMSEMFNFMVDKLQNWHKELEGEVERRSIDLMAEETKVRLLLDSTTEGIYGVDINGNCTFANPSCVKILGYGDMNQLMGKNMHYLMHHTRKNGDPYPVEECRIYEAFRERRATNVEDEFFWRTDGTGFAVEYRSNPIWQDDKVIGTVITFIDITERVQAGQELAKYRDRLEKLVKERTNELSVANKELEAFSYSVSHDLRAPLRAIDGFSQALLEDYFKKLDEQGRDYLQRVRAASQHMGELIDDLLALSRVTRSEIRHNAVDLSIVTHSIANELQKNQPWRQVEFVIQEGLIAEADANLLRLVIENLLGNAWKFTGKKDKAHIEFGANETEGETVYYVRDNGAGFDMQYVDKLFNPFQRLHKVEEFPGTGIGLATVQRIIQRHGGRVWAKGEVDKGAAFYFTL